MATFFSGVKIGFWASATNYMYATLTGTVSRSGNTVTLSGMSLSLTTDKSSTGYDANWYFIVNGTKTSGRCNAPPSTFALSNTSFTVSKGDTSKSVSWSSVDGYSGSFTVTFPSGYVAPNQPSISLGGATQNSINISYGTSSFGDPSTGTVYLYGGTATSPTTQITSKTTTGTSTYTHSGLIGNAKYYYRSRAYNSQLYSSYSLEVALITLPPQATNQTVTEITATSAKINWTSLADGGAYGKTYSYSLDGGSTWVNCGSRSAGPGQTDADMSYTITGLSQATSYTVKFRVSTTAGITACDDFVFQTLGIIYGSVSGKTKKIKKLYGSVNGKTKLIKKLYASVNGKTKRIW